MGDFGYAINLDNGYERAFVVADIGPSEAGLGEMSIALATALGGQDPNPRTGGGTPKGRILYVVFPGSGLNLSWPVEDLKMVGRTKELLASIGGRAGLIACKDTL